ncbi:MAG: ATP-dependent DNA helicase RecG [Phycisphaerae bacterium]
MIVPEPHTLVQYLKGVGPKRAEFFADVGVRTVADLLNYFPFRHEPEPVGCEIADLQPGPPATIAGEVIRVGGRQPGRVIELHDGSDSIRLRWFNTPREVGRIHVGCTVVATGAVEVYNDELTMVQPAVAVYPPGQAPPVLAAHPGRRLVGVYSGTARLKSTLVRKAVLSLLAFPRLPVAELLPEALRRKHDLLERERAYRAMHAPADEREHEQARRTLAYEELLLLELAMALRRRKALSTQTADRFLVTPEIDRRIRARFPFALTDAQNATIRDIVRDLRSGRPMTRLLQGDVGSGKTVVALYACLAAVAAGSQAAIMAPTEILAAQHFNNIEKYLAGSRVRRALVRGGQSPAARAAQRGAIERGEIDLIVGTQALIQKDVAFARLGLVVVDEQHKFGVLQRHDFRTKGAKPHYLVMTATPIPRTLAMTVFGDLDVSVIRQSPPGRGRVITKLVADDRSARVMTYVAGRLRAGEQAYVVCPQIGAEYDAVGAAVDEASTGDAPLADAPERATAPPATHTVPQPAGRASADRTTTEALVTARDTFDRLRRGPWADLTVALLHGGLSPREREKVVGEFAAGTLHALVATTIVEVGIDVPNATVMVIENADRFGLSQLHQLRGRVGRGPRDSLCVLIAHGRSRKSAERLNAMVQTTDGFRIAEADLAQRGPGEVFGTRQHGLPALRVASILGDFALLEQAREDAFALVAEDPALRRPEHAALVPAIEALFGKSLVLIDAA